MSYEEKKKEFIKALMNASIRHDKNKVFSDWLEVMSLSLKQVNNRLYGKIDEDIEKEFENIKKQYEKNEWKEIETLYPIMVLAFEYKLGDFLGEIFMEAGLGDKNGKGQCFTPYTLSHLMSQITFTKEEIQKSIDEKGYIGISDCCCGGGCLLVSAFETVRDLGFNPNTQMLVICGDLDRRCAEMTYLTLSCLGVPAIVSQHDALKVEEYDRFETLFYHINRWKYRNSGDDKKSVVNSGNKQMELF